MIRIPLLLLVIFSSVEIFAQDAYVKEVLKENREKLYHNLVNNSITKNLSTPLSDSTEESWQDAFGAMELINFRSPWINNQVTTAIKLIQQRRISFQRSLLELIYTNYPIQYEKEVKALLESTNDEKIFCMCAVYLLKMDHTSDLNKYIAEKIIHKFSYEKEDPYLSELLYQLMAVDDGNVSPYLYEFLEKSYLPGNILLISFQRKNRDYPGLVLVRDTNGSFIKNADSTFFSVPQLARSITNLPGYLANGNTPEGIFRMDGFDHSKSSFIGPTTNIQLTMPFEFRASHFYKDSTLTDSTWDIEHYKKLLPTNFKNYFPMLQSYHAGKAGRTEIIAHGTTIDPGYYKGKSYYPLTPTQGCLCSKEIWSESTGRLMESDQQKLADVITKAGGPSGYLIVINLDDKQEPVSITDINPFLKIAGQN